MRKFFLKEIKSKNQIYFTFDDGPDEVNTPKILDILQKYNIKATFFLIGEKAEKHPAIVKRQLAEGHTVGEHSYKHTHAWKSTPFATAFDLIKGNKSLKKVTGLNQINYFRPPYGKFNLVTLLYLWIFRKKVVFWDIDPNDYKSSKEKISQYIFNNSGNVILLHDGRQSLSNISNSTISALDNILRQFKREKIIFEAF